MPPRFASFHLLPFHRRLCDGDRTVSDELAELLLTPMFERMSRQFPRADEHMLAEAVSEAFLDYCARPQQFDEGRGVPLVSFLLMTSGRNMRNLLRGEKRRKAREERAAPIHARSIVELDSTVGNLLQQEENAQLHRQEEDVMGLLQDPQDRQILALRLRGGRSTEAFAEILGIAHLSIEVQRREVKRAKDRIDKTLRRHGGRL